MPSEPGPLRRYAVAAGAAVGALLLTPVLRPLLEPLPGVLVGVAILGSAWYGGVGPGLLATALAVAGGVLCFPPPANPDPAWLPRLGIFLVATLLLGRQSTTSRRARATLHFLADAGKTLAASLDYQTTLTAAARLPVPALADGCVLDLLGDDGALRPVAVAHADPEREAKLRASVWGQPGVSHRLEAHAGPGEGEFGVLLAEQVTDEARREALGALGVRSILVVPLVARGRTIGTLTLLSARRLRRYGRRDLPLGEELAQRAALAIDNARLYREARDMEAALRRRAEQLAAAHRHKDEFLAVLAHELRNPLGALRSALEVLRRRVPEEAPEAPRG